MSYSIGLYDVHLVTIDPEVHGGKSAGVDDLWKVRVLAILDHGIR